MPLPDPTRMRDAALEAARRWGLELEDPFPLAQWSYVAPAGDAVVKVAWDGDEESLHEADALRTWDGNGAVRLLGEDGRALLLERARPGTDLAALPEREATAIAVELATRLWVPARAPFRDIYPEVRRWATDPAALDLLAQIERPAEWLVHGDFHHHNMLLGGDRYVAIDPKPYAADREYDVPSFLWNPMTNRLDDRGQLEDRIAAFVAAGLDDFRIRAWTMIRGSYLRPEFAEPIRALF
jgi:streptomycin 6-kinase